MANHHKLGTVCTFSTTLVNTVYRKYTIHGILQMKIKDLTEVKGKWPVWLGQDQGGATLTHVGT